jgi:LPPG:FO 2-phospho-L-lactate transferase
VSEKRVVVLSGGVGGAKLAHGLYKVLPPGALTVVVNTGDDFDHLGLKICPDIDTMLYTLSSLANQNLGWGRADETWSFMEAIAEFGGENWFRLGDRDLALHVMRTRALAAGMKLSEFIALIARKLDIKANILPATETSISTVIDTDEGSLDFQDYFVRRQCQPKVTGIRYTAASQSAGAGVLESLCAPDLGAIIIAPSNPYLSIAPMLAVPGIHKALIEAKAPIIAVTPIIGGSAVKGPTVKIMKELQLASSALTVANYYSTFIDGFVLDKNDTDLLAEIPVSTVAIDTLMTTVADRQRVASETLAFARSFRGAGDN